MGEIRRQLTDIQFKAIVSAQLRLDEAQKRVGEMQARMEETTALVFDAHGIPIGAQAVLSQETREIIIPIADSNPPPILGENPPKPTPPPLRDVKEGVVPAQPK